MEMAPRTTGVTFKGSAASVKLYQHLTAAKCFSKEYKPPSHSRSFPGKGKPGRLFPVGKNMAKRIVFPAECTAPGCQEKIITWGYPPNAAKAARFISKC